MDTTLILEHLDWVRSLAGRLVKDANVAEDLVQEAWLAAGVAPPRDPDLIRPWFRGTLKNLVAARVRKDSNRRAREESVARSEVGLSSQELTGRVETEQALVARVMEMEEPYRRTLLLRYFEDLGPRAIADQEGTSLNTVKSRLRRAHDQLREKLNAEYGGNGKGWLTALAPVASKGFHLEKAAAPSSSFAAAWWIAGLAAAAMGLMVIWPAPDAAGGDLSAVADAGVPPRTEAEGHGDAVALTPVAAERPPEDRPQVKRPTYAQSVRVTVRSHETGQPMPGVTVHSLDRERRDDPEILIHRKNRTLWEAFENVAVPHVTGPDGAVDIPWSGEGAQLAARSAGLWGGTGLDRNSPTEAVLELYENETLCVRVVDEAGAPAQGVSVAVTRKSWENPLQRKRTDRQGVARFTDIGALARQFEMVGTLSVCLAYPGAPETLTLVPKDPNGAFGSEELKLVAPAFGSIHVRLEGGAALRNAFQLDAIGPKRSPRHLVAFDEKGEATIPAVGLGRGFRIQWAQDGDGHMMKVDGPTRAGETVSVTLSPAHRDPARPVAPKAKILVLDSDRRPLRSTRLRMWETHGTSRSGGGHVQTDREGRLLLPLGIRNGKASPITVIELHLVENGSTATGVIRVDPVPVGERVDAGSVVVRTNPPVVSGRVMGPDGLPLEGASVTLEEYESTGADDGASGWWSEPAGAVGRTDADGRFSISAAVKSQRLRVLATAKGLVGVHQTVYPKQSNAALWLARPVSSELRVVAKTPQTLSGLGLQLVGLNPPASLSAEQEVRGGTAATFRWSGIAAGRYELMLKHEQLGFSSSSPTISLGMVTVGSDGKLSPDCGELDLSRYLAERTLTVVDAGGVPAQECAVIIQHATKPNHFLNLETDPLGKLVIVSRRDIHRIVTCGERSGASVWFELKEDRHVVLPAAK